jgi:hypothetical protein
MIDDAVRDMVRYGDQVALQSSGDPPTENLPRYLSAEKGGPPADKLAFDLTGRSSVKLWELWKIVRKE